MANTHSNYSPVFPINLEIQVMADKSDQQAYLVKFLSTAPVAATIWLTITAGILIEFNRFFPDLLFHPLP